MFIKRMVFILAAVMAAAPVFAGAPLINASARDRIPHEYVVVFKSATSEELKKSLQEIGNVEDYIQKQHGTILFTYQSALLGFAARIPKEVEGTVLDKVRNVWGSVKSVEANIPAAPAATVPKGLDRIDQRLLPLKEGLPYTETGEGVHVYVIDTGILSSHREFTGGRVSNGCSAFDNTCNTNTNTNPNTKDCNGHGTHVAGTIGGNNYGVAKHVTLHPVRVLDCDGFGALAGILAGVNWVMEHKMSPAVANMSLRLTGQSPALKSAIKTSIDAKITYVVAAGNLLGRNACNYSPADVTDAITVGSVNPENDRRSVLSAIGQCIDLFAPGVRILSATVSGGNNDAWEIMSGTSMAAAHVSGVVALYLQNHADAAPSQVRTALGRSDNVSNTPGWSGVDNRGPCSPNEMLHWGSRDDGFNDDPLPDKKQTNAPNRNGIQ
jgi:subtilisin family serine protease